MTRGYGALKCLVGDEAASRMKYTLLGRNGIVISEHPDNEKLYCPSARRKKVFVIGNFESPQYFENVKETLMQEFTPIHPELKENEELYKAIRSTNSICLAVRRGDFLNDSNKDTFHVCTLSYYERAIKYINRHVTTPTYFVFSNDIEWVKKHLKTGQDTYYESGSDPTWETFRLMYSCKHFIISNSTLHWWAQCKGSFEDKIVIAPSIWYNAPGWENHLMQDHFVRL